MSKSLDMANEFMKLTSSTKVAGATTRLTLTIGHKLRTPSSGLLKNVIDSLGDWENMTLILENFPAEAPFKTYRKGCFTSDDSFDYAFPQEKKYSNEDKRKNNMELFGSELFEIERYFQYENYDKLVEATWNTKGILKIKGENLNRFENFSFYVNNPQQRQESVKMTLYIGTTPIKESYTDAFNVDDKNTVPWEMLSPLWVSDPPMKVRVPYTDEEFNEATETFNFDDLKGTSLASKVWRFNISTMSISKNRPSTRNLFLLATNILVQLFGMPMKVKEYMKKIVSTDKVFIDERKIELEKTKKGGVKRERTFWFIHYFLKNKNILSDAISEYYGLEKSDPRLNIFSQLEWWGKITEEWDKQGIFEGMPFLPLPGSRLMGMDPMTNIMTNYRFLNSVSLYGNKRSEDPYYPGNYENIIEIVESRYPMVYHNEGDELLRMIRRLLEYLQEPSKKRPRFRSSIQSNLSGHNVTSFGYKF